MCIFGRPIKDFILIPPKKKNTSRTIHGRTQLLHVKIDALRNRHMRCAERLTGHTKRLLPLVVGDHVRIENQTGPHPLKWDKTGVVKEVR
jgi:hypothetical protein